MPKRRAGNNVWRFYQTCTPVGRTRLNKNPAFAKKKYATGKRNSRFDATQNVGRTPHTTLFPSLLRRSMIMDLQLRRPHLAKEGLEVHGFNMYEDGDDACKVRERPSFAWMALR